MKKFAWSFSVITQYENCPKAFFYNKIAKVKQAESWARTEGSRVGNLAEQYVLGKIKGVPKELRKFKNKLNELRDYGAETEVDLAVTREWEETTWDNWNSVWCRAKDDFQYMDDLENKLVIIDGKTGGNYPSHKDQTHLYATLAFSHYLVNTILVEDWYYKTGEIGHSTTYRIEDYEKMKSYWEKRAEKLEKAINQKNSSRAFNCTPGPCGWCPFTKAKGGPCKY